MIIFVHTDQREPDYILRAKGSGCFSSDWKDISAEVKAKHPGEENTIKEMLSGLRKRG